MKTIKIATRKSPLALAQTHSIIALLKNYYPQIKFTTIPLTSLGDEDSRSLQNFSEIGIFVKTLENALFQEEADCALHCLKDLPAPMTDSFVLPCYLPREEVNDALICRKKDWREATDHEILSQIKIIATGSSRRRIFLKHHYPNWEFIGLRGNINTRLRKLLHQHDDMEGVILAQVGIRRLHDYCRNHFDPLLTDTDQDGYNEFIDHINQLRIIPISTDVLLPSPGQGILVFQCRIQDTETTSLLKKLNHPLTEKLAVIEREVMMKVEGGCRTPLGVWAHETSHKSSLKRKILIEAIMERDGVIASITNENYIEEFNSNSPTQLSHRLANKLLKKITSLQN